MKRLIPTLFFALLTMHPALRAADVNLAGTPGVTYRYFDGNGREIPGKNLGDPDCRFLTDGKTDSKEVAQTVYRNAQPKSIRVRFEFPRPITITGVDLSWMWGHNEKHWFDTATVSAGNEPDKLAELTVFRRPTDRKYGNSTTFRIPLPKAVNARFFEVDVKQEADLAHYMFAISEIALLGPAQQAANRKPAQDRPLFTFVRKSPINLFDAKQEVELPIKLETENASGEISYELRDYFGNCIDSGSPQTAPGATEARIALGKLPPGYYELALDVESEAADRTVRKQRGNTSFLVAPFFERTMQEALTAGARFGIQFGFGSPEVSEGFTKLGLPWRRGLLCFAPLTGDDPARPNWTKTDQFLKTYFSGHDTVGMFEVKTVPSYCYDEKRFGKKTGDWCLRMPNDKALYQNFITEQIKRVPPEQKYFEIWNEPWDLYDAKDFAVLAQWTLEAIKRARPDAQVGPNLGPMGHLAGVIEHGGMDGMDFLAIHPYSPDFRSSPERSELRERIRNYHRLLRDKLGHDLPLYVTEIGWPTPPQGPVINTEHQQAAYMARAALIMFAEDIKAVMPYCMGQPEKNPADKEHFFGFVRRDLSPKPVLAAYATVARLLEGSAYLGDLDLGSDIGAMLFRLPDGRRMAALYTDGPGQKILFRPDCDRLTRIDIVGNSEELEVRNGKLPLTLTEDPVYLVGLGPAVEEKLTRDGGRWSGVLRRGKRECRFAADPAAAFGAPGVQWHEMSATGIDKNKFLVRWAAAWNRQYLLLDFRITDDQPGWNPGTGADVWKGDAIELFVSARPDRVVPGFLKEFDYQLLFTPFAGNSRKEVAVYGMCGDNSLCGKPIPGVKAEYRVEKDGWNARLAIPFAALGLADGPLGKIGLEVAVDNRGKEQPRFQVNSNSYGDNSNNPAVWSELELLP